MIHVAVLEGLAVILVEVEDFLVDSIFGRVEKLKPDAVLFCQFQCLDIGHAANDITDILQSREQFRAHWFFDLIRIVADRLRKKMPESFPKHPFATPPVSVAELLRGFQTLYLSIFISTIYLYADTHAHTRTCTHMHLYIHI